MAWRFKPSKFKNTVPIAPKFDHVIRDLAVGSFMSHGNLIASSAAFVAFNWEAQGTSLAVLPLGAQGRQDKTRVPILHAHSEFVTDFQFSPFDDGLLASGSQDTIVKLWRIPESGLPSSKPLLELPAQSRRIETVNFHPAADYVLATTSSNRIVIWDLVKAEELYTFLGHDDEVQCVSWQYDGKLLASQCKDRILRVLDPREDSVAAECSSHRGIKDSKVVWVDSNRLLTTGFDFRRMRQITLRDIRNIKKSLQDVITDNSSGILVPLFDPDTKMCFLCGKGDRTIQFVEITDNNPFIVEGLVYTGDQTKGACLVPKRALDVMRGEVNRIMQLCNNSIAPITWQVPRKSYREYHPDIYPDTRGIKASMQSKDWWFDGQNKPVKKIQLDPKKRPKTNLIVFQQHPLHERGSTKEESIYNDAKETKTQQNGHSSLIVTNNGHNVKETPKDRPNFEDNVTTNNGFKCPPQPSGLTRSHTIAAGDRRLKPEPMTKPGKLRSPFVSPCHNSMNEVDDDLINGNVNNNASEDKTDESLMALRRQPSIKDRKRLLEENLRKHQECKMSDSNRVDVKTLSRQPSLVEPLMKKNDSELERTITVRRRESDLIIRRKKSIFDHHETTAATTVTQNKPTANKFFGRICKFKHLKGDVILKERFENLKNLSRTIPAESNFFHANKHRVAVPLSGPGGKIAVFETSKPGRLPDGVTPVLINGTGVTDFSFDPFDTSRLVASCDDGSVRVWRIPLNGLMEQTNKPEAVFSAHKEKIQLLKFHPLASDILLTAAFDRTVFIWNLRDTTTPMLELEGHEDQLYSAEWSSSGRFVATVCKDGRIRVYEPRSGSAPLVEGGDIVAKKGARVVWVLDGKYLIVTGFGTQSERIILVYLSSNLEKVHSQILDASPAILVPHYDEDSNTLFLTGKGESTVTTFEVIPDTPYLYPLTPYSGKGLHQGLSFLPKNVCNVRLVEFAKAFRLLNSVIEPVSFTVPRVKTAFFQDDIFPATRVVWEPALSAEEWLSGCQKLASRVSLQPKDMKTLSGQTNTSDCIQSAGNKNGVGKSCLVPQVDRLSLKQKQAGIEQSISNLLTVTTKVDQDKMEGVDENEWDD